MKRTAVNPWAWSVNLGFDQAQLVEGPTRQLVCGGQTAVDADGNLQHPGDMAAQLELALDNLETVLARAGMTFANLIRLNIYTTDVDALLEHLSVLSGRLEGARHASTLLGAARLHLPVGAQIIEPLYEDDTPLTLAELLADQIGGYQPPPTPP